MLFTVHKSFTICVLCLLVLRVFLVVVPLLLQVAIMKVPWLSKMRQQSALPQEPSSPARTKRPASSDAASAASPSKRWRADILQEAILRPDQIQHVNPALILQGEILQTLAGEGTSDMEMTFLRVPHAHTYCTLCSGSEALHRRACVS